MNELSEIIAQASARVSKDYFQLPIDGADDPIYRERVYCYELYHQLRTLWPKSSEYSLGGEVDKSGHPLIRGNNLDCTKPDFLIHRPGDMSGNYAIIEVKPSCASTASVCADLRTLDAFLQHAGYLRGLCYVYGHQAEQLLSRISGEFDERIEFWAHSGVGQSARRLP